VGTSPRCTDCEIAVALQARRKSQKNSNPDLPPSSAKIREIVDRLHTIDGKEVADDEMPEKTIVFSQFTSFREAVNTAIRPFSDIVAVDILQPFLDDEGLKYTRRTWFP